MVRTRFILCGVHFHEWTAYVGLSSLDGAGSRTELEVAMSFRRVSYIIIAVGIVVVACAAWFLYSRHEAQAAAVRERFRQLDAAYSKRNKLVISLRAERSKVTALLNDGFDASRRRHDEADSLSLDDMAALARKEKKDYEDAQSVQTKLEHDDEAVSAIYSELYGANATSAYRNAFHSRNEAMDDAISMNWRAAQSLEDNIKIAIANDDSPGNSGDEINRDYDDGAKDINKYETLDKTVQSEGLVFDHRMTTDWQQAKKDVGKL